MARQDPERLAAALRENLRKRKERMRAAVDGGKVTVAVDSGADEEGDAPIGTGADRPGAWVRESSSEL